MIKKVVAYLITLSLVCLFCFTMFGIALGRTKQVADHKESVEFVHLKELLASQNKVETVETEPVETEPVIEETEQETIPQPPKYTDREIYLLRLITEHEAGTEDIVCRMLIVQVILNRVESPYFPNTIEEVIFEKGQFTPASYANFYDIPVSEDTVIAVSRALNGDLDIKNFARGALFFNHQKSQWLPVERMLFQYGVVCFYK